VVASARPLFSIGAVSRMLDLSAVTIRTWESRYGLVKPERSAGGQRLYSREQVEQLRFVCRQIESGRRPAEAHRLLGERLAHGDSLDGTGTRVLLAQSGLAAAQVLRELIGRKALDALRGAGAADAPLVVVDTGGLDLDELSARLQASGAKVVPIDT
jgi:DNA-binding transcriptional MerR regulator